MPHLLTPDSNSGEDEKRVACIGDIEAYAANAWPARESRVYDRRWTFRLSPLARPTCG